jgi:hypothetical protein
VTEPNDTSLVTSMLFLCTALLLVAPWFSDWAVWLKLVTDAGILAGAALLEHYS